MVKTTTISVVVEYRWFKLPLCVIVMDGQWKRSYISSKLQSNLLPDMMNGPKQEEVKAEEAALAKLEQELENRSGLRQLQTANHFENQNNLASFEDVTFKVTNSRVPHLTKTILGGRPW